MCECKCNQTDYFENEAKIEELRKLVNSDMWKQDTIKIKKILIRIQNELNDKWNKSVIVLAKLNAEMSKIHDAKEGKFFTDAQENRLRVLRKRCVIIGYYRYKIINDKIRCGVNKPITL